MLQFGPLRHLWSMRFEANHQYFKQMARRVKNTLNITSTLSERYQMRQCYERSGTNCLASCISLPEYQKPVGVKDLPQQLQQILLTKFALPEDEQCFSVKWLLFSGNKPFLDGLLLLYSADSLPVFTRIKHILLCRK